MTISGSRSRQASRSGWRQAQRLAITAASALTIALNSWMPAQADPFRSTNPRPVGPQVEAAFKALFEQGNYKQAAQFLQSAEPNEPLGYALKAALAYVDGDMDSLGTNATQTRETAERLVATDPLRGHLYIAAGHFLEGAYTLSTQNTVTATPAVLGKLQQVFDNISQAEAIDPQDPELNLIKGYMDLMLAVNLPFSSPDQAIERLNQYAAPAYLAQRGIAIGYRDLDQDSDALTAINNAIRLAQNNPELYYLRAQIKVNQEDYRGSLPDFRRALDKADQLPFNIHRQIIFEDCQARNRVNNRNADCDAVRDRLPAP